MHITIAAMYATVLWLATLTYTAVVGGFWIVTALAGPLIVSSAVFGLLALDMLVVRILRRVRPKPAPEVAPEPASGALPGAQLQETTAI